MVRLGLSISNVLYLPDLQVNLFSQKQAMREGATITLSSDGSNFTVTPTTGSPMDFKFGGTFWRWDDISPNTVSTSAVASPFFDSLLSLSVSRVAHSGAMHEFLLLHFRMGHLSYQVMLRALQSGTWTGFQHSLKTIHLDQLPHCPICLCMKNKHKPIPNVGRIVQPRPGLLFRMDLKTVRTRSINHQHYVVDIIDDNSGRAHVYCIRRRSDALRDALQVFHNTVCRPRGINFFALRLDNAGELMSHEVQN